MKSPIPILIPSIFPFGIYTSLSSPIKTTKHLTKHPPQPQETPTRVYGAAYHIPPPHVESVKAYLDIREINGYSIQYTPFNPIPDSISTDSTANKITIRTIPKCMVYIGLPDNPQFLGRQDPQDVAGVIAKSIGPSGPNSEYLFMLEEALEGLAPESGDGHVKDLVRRVRVLMGDDDGDGNGEGTVAGHAVGSEVERVRSGDGGKPVEETEKVS